MAKKYIDVDAFIRFIDCGHLRPPMELCFSEKDVVDMINKFPAADVVEVKRGAWTSKVKHYKDEQQEFDYYKIFCSVCGMPPEKNYHLTKFCPNCGAALTDHTDHFPCVVGQPAEMFVDGKWIKGKIVEGYRFNDGIVTIETEDGKQYWCGQSRTELYRPLKEETND